MGWSAPRVSKACVVKLSRKGRWIVLDQYSQMVPRFYPRTTFDPVIKLTQTLTCSNIVFYSMSTCYIHISRAINCSEMKFSLVCSSFTYEQNEELLPEIRVCGTATAIATPASSPLRLRLLTDSDSCSYSDSGSRSRNRSGAGAGA